MLLRGAIAIAPCAVTSWSGDVAARRGLALQAARAGARATSRNAKQPGCS